ERNKPTQSAPHAPPPNCFGKGLTQPGKPVRVSHVLSPSELTGREAFSPCGSQGVKHFLKRFKMAPERQLAITAIPNLELTLHVRSPFDHGVQVREAVLEAAIRSSTPRDRHGPRERPGLAPGVTPLLPEFACPL